MRTLLIDGDILVYRITAANERPIDWGNDLSYNTVKQTKMR